MPEPVDVGCKLIHILSLLPLDRIGGYLAQLFHLGAGLWARRMRAPSRSSFATSPALKPLDRTGHIFKFRAWTLVHAFSTEINKGHEIKPFVRYFPSTGRLCKISLDNFIRRFEMSPASGPFRKTIQTPAAAHVIQRCIPVRAVIHDKFLGLIFADGLDRTGFRAGISAKVGLADIFTGHKLCRGKIGLGNNGNQSLPGSELRGKQQVVPAESANARSQSGMLV